MAGRAAPRKLQDEKMRKSKSISSGRSFADIIAEREGRLKKPSEMTVYFIRCGEMVKIGVSDNPKARLRNIQTCNPAPAEIVKTELGGPGREQALHRRFWRQHERGEWFRYEGALRRYVEGPSDA
jgi:hypothetical protein